MNEGNSSMGIEKELNYRLFYQREEMLEHVGYEEEYRLYHAVATGNIALVEEICQRLYEAGCIRQRKQRSSL